MKDPARFWDDMYDVDHYRYGTAPNAFVRRQAEHLPDHCRVLCVGDGEGRNGVWLAEQGFVVTSVEPSAVGVDKIRKLASERGVDLTVIQGALPEVDLDAGAYKGAVLTYIHLPPDTREAVHRAVVDALDHEGLVLLEAFTPDQLQFDSGGPKNPDMLYTADLLREDFDGLDFELLEELQLELDEGPGHTGPASVVQLRGRKR